MADTIRSLSALQTLLADNTARAVSAQDLRDAIYSALGVVPYVSKATDYPATENDEFIAVDATSADVAITLPAVATTRVGKRYTIKKIDSSGNAAKIDPTSTEAIDGSSTTISITTQYMAYTLVNNGSSWYVESKYTP